MTVWRVAAFTQGTQVPSARFRVDALVSPLVDHGIQMTPFPALFGSYPPPGIVARLAWLPRAWHERRAAIRCAQADHDVGLFQREMISTLASAESAWRKPAVLDVDDAIWLNQRLGGVDKLARRMGNVIAGNACIADYFADKARVWVLPTAVDAQRYCPALVLQQRPVMVWSGSASGLGYLQAIAPALRRVLDAMPDLVLRVVCDARPELAGLDPARIDYIRWQPDVEVAALQSATVGLMPMPDTPWTRGKCSFKMLTYMACGLPVVVSPYGMNADVLAQACLGLGAGNEDEWIAALLYLLRDQAAARAMGEAGRAQVLEHYSVAVMAPRLAAILKEVAA